MIHFKNVSKKFAVGKSAVTRLNFSIPVGEFVFIVGPSGAGKTTILKLISSQLTPTSGTIKVNNIEISPKGCKKKIELRQKIGFVFQDFKVLSYKTIFENVALSLKVKKNSEKEIKTSVKQALKTVGLADKELLFPLQLSAGELQRVAIARAIAGDRDIILADEPTGNLDPKTAWNIMSILKKLEGKKTIIIATHNTDIVNSMRKRVITLREGKIISDEKKGKYKF